jgi:hypothetical protein
MVNRKRKVPLNKLAQPILRPEEETLCLESKSELGNILEKLNDITKITARVEEGLSISRPVTVTHLGQAHWASQIATEPDPQKQNELKNTVLSSQMKIRSYLKQHPDAAIFVEGAWHDEFPEDLTVPVEKNKRFEGLDKLEKEALKKSISRRKAAKRTFDKLFPNGMPSDLNSLSQEQKEFTVRRLSADLMLLSGEIKSIYSTSNLELESWIHGKVKELCVKIDKKCLKLNRKKEAVFKDADEVKETFRNKVNLSEKEKESWEALKLDFEKKFERIDQIQGKVQGLEEEQNRFVFDLREAWVMINLMKFIENRDPQDNREIIIVYGSNHDFGKYFKNLNQNKVKFNKINLNE